MVKQLIDEFDSENAEFAKLLKKNRTDWRELLQRIAVLDSLERKVFRENYTDNKMIIDLLDWIEVHESKASPKIA